MRSGARPSTTLSFLRWSSAKERVRPVTTSPCRGEMCERLTAGKHTPERCVEVAFRFLLDREPKESILGRFDATAISRYFPEFEREMPRYFSQF